MLCLLKWFGEGGCFVVVCCLFFFPPQARLFSSRNTENKYLTQTTFGHVLTSSTVQSSQSSSTRSSLIFDTGKSDKCSTLRPITWMLHVPQKIYTTTPIRMLVWGQTIFTSDMDTTAEFHCLNCPLIYSNRFVSLHSQSQDTSLSKMVNNFNF